MGDNRRRDIDLHGGRPVDPDQTTADVLNHLKVMEEKLEMTNPRMRRNKSVSSTETEPVTKSVFDMIRDN